MELDAGAGEGAAELGAGADECAGEGAAELGAGADEGATTLAVFVPAVEEGAPAPRSVQVTSAWRRARRSSTHSG